MDNGVFFQTFQFAFARSKYQDNIQMVASVANNIQSQPFPIGEFLTVNEYRPD